MKKVIFIDYSYFVHRSIFGCQRRNTLDSVVFQCTRSILNCLHQIFITHNDLIIFAIDSPLGSWRKIVDPNYKANREEARKISGIDWDYYFKEFSNLLENIKISTPFYKIEVDRLEADDIISVGCRYFKDREVIILSADSDFDQLTAYPNVKILNPVKKIYNIIKNPYKSLDKKTRSDRSDNLKSKPKTMEEIKIRNSIVNLLKLPDYVEENVQKAFKENLAPKTYNWELFKVPQLSDKLQNVYNNEHKKILTYNNSFKKRYIQKKVELTSIL